MIRLLYITTFFLLSLKSYSQINHWETAVFANDSWSYFVGNSNPGMNWYTTGFDDSAWNTGAGGFGYADGDDATTFSTTPSVFIRTDFNIVETFNVGKAVFNIDYDDSFVAYLNGVEIARSNIGTIGTPLVYNELANSNHEAQMYSGGDPEYFILNQTTLNSVLVQGNNVLAIEVHNVTNTSSDMSCIPFLSLGITNLASDYSPTPTWFEEPFSFFSSNIPIVKINTFNQPIVDDPRIPAELEIIYNGIGNTNYVTDIANEFSGDIMIEQRGESSAGFDKKSWFFETVNSLGEDTNVSFLDFPKEEDWILYGPFSDKTFLRNILTMKIGREMGAYHSRTQAVEVLLNDEYVGVYVLMEKIKRDKNRLDIAKMQIADTTGVELTGGYVFRTDKGIHDGWFSDYDVPNNPGNKMYFQYVYPKATEIQQRQKNYIETFVDSFENALSSPTFFDAYGNRYNDFIEFRSFFDFFIINEVANNIDGYRLSSYFHKNKNTKDGLLHAGPFWDFNLSFGNGDYCDGWQTDEWQYLGCGQSGAFWWETFLTDTMYTRGLRCRWEELRETTLNTDYLMNYLDSMQVLLNEPADRNYEVYDVLGTYLWPNPAPWYATYDGEVNDMENWLDNRLDWLDNNIPGISANCEDFEPYVEPEDTVVDPIDTTLAIGGINRNLYNIRIQPNPIKDNAMIFLDSKGEDQFLELYTVMGKLINKSEAFQGGMYKFDRNDLPSGVYYVKVLSRDKVIGSIKVFVSDD